MLILADGHDHLLRLEGDLGVGHVLNPLFSPSAPLAPVM